MEKILLNIKEFLQFRQVAELYRIRFTYGIKKGTVTVQARASDLETIGF